MQEGLGNSPHVSLKAVSQSGNRCMELGKTKHMAQGASRTPASLSRRRDFQSWQWPWLDEASNGGRVGRVEGVLKN